MPQHENAWGITPLPQDVVAFRFSFGLLVRWPNAVGEDDWTWSRGPQMVGFALWHVHPAFAVVGMLASFAMGVWLLVSIPVAILRRREIGWWDWLMIVGAVCVIIVLVLPDTFFARLGGSAGYQ